MPEAKASLVIDAPIDPVWALIRAFGSFQMWVPGIERIELRNGTATTIGAIQHITFQDGSVRQEELLDIDDDARVMTYKSIGERPPPARNLVGRIALSLGSQPNFTRIERCVTFDCDLVPDELQKFVEGIEGKLSESLMQLSNLLAGKTALQA